MKGLYSTEQKRSHVAAWRQSGLSQRAYCSEHQLNIAIFKNWPRRYGTGDSFIPVVVDRAVNRYGLLIRFPNGIEVDVPSKYLAQALRVLLGC